jgi:hypothetical protein
MTGRRHALDTIADLLGLPRLAVRAVEHRANGDYALVLSHRRGGSEMPRWTWSRRVLRIPRRRVEGYRPRTPYVRPRDARARRKQNAWHMALWLLGRLDASTPVVARALWGGELEAINELRAAILAAASPEPEVVFVFLAGNNGGGERAA